MQLIVYYVVFMIAGDIAAYLIGLVVEREFGSHVSLIVFLALYFLFLWIAWLFAVRVTRPKEIQAAGAA
jgi:membrane protein implicated in regulation of membrane protease activity